MATALDELQACADQAARQIDAQRAELDASSQHTARVEREAQAEPAADQQAETPYDMKMELKETRPRLRCGPAGLGLLGFTQGDGHGSTRFRPQSQRSGNLSLHPESDDFPAGREVI